jgi:two-component system cell cycle response regulator DivK
MEPEQFRILLVEDDPINAYVVTETFEDYHITVVDNGMEALAKVEEEPFHLILMDINLRDTFWDGTKVMQAIRENPGMESIPIFAVTSYALPGDEQFFIEAGFDEYVPKPLTQENLGALIERERKKYNQNA